MTGSIVLSEDTLHSGSGVLARSSATYASGTVAPEQSVNQRDDTGWSAHLSCGFDAGPRNTVVRHTHTGPLRIQRPFYPEGTTAHVYMLHPPGGVVGGDDLQVDVVVKDNASGLVTTPGAMKFYRSEGKIARVQQNLSTNGHLEWFPQENIFFNGSQVSIDTKITIQGKSSLAYWDINCFGRLAGNHPLNEGSVTTKVTLYRRDDHCSNSIFLDRFCFDGQHSVTRITGLRGHSVCGMMILNPLPAECAEAARSLLSGDPLFSVSCVDDLLIVRYVGDSAEHAKEGFIKLWSHHRFALSQRAPCVPRIWAT